MIKAAARGLVTIATIAALQLADESLSSGVGLISEAQARIGRPLTPGSVAGVSRRVYRRTARRISVLPAGCHYGLYYGNHCYRCGSQYYIKDVNVYVQITF
jgi:hypothetical protein